MSASCVIKFKQTKYQSKHMRNSNIKRIRTTQVIIKSITSNSHVPWWDPIRAGRRHHDGPPYCVQRCAHPLQTLLVTKYTLLGIVVKINHTAQTIFLLTLKPRVCTQEGQFGLATDTTSGRHIVSSAVHILFSRCYLVTKYTLFGIVVKANHPAQTIFLLTNDTTTS